MGPSGARVNCGTGVIHLVKSTLTRTVSGGHILCGEREEGAEEDSSTASLAAAGPTSKEAAEVSHLISTGIGDNFGLLLSQSSINDFTTTAEPCCQSRNR